MYKTEEVGPSLPLTRRKRDLTIIGCVPLCTRALAASLCSVFKGLVESTDKLVVKCTKYLLPLIWVWKLSGILYFALKAWSWAL
jgi:hypothetical protein